MQSNQDIKVTKTLISYNKYIVDGKEVDTQSNSLDVSKDLSIVDRIEIGDFSGKNLPGDKLIVIDGQIYRINNDMPAQQNIPIRDNL